MCVKARECVGNVVWVVVSFFFFLFHSWVVGCFFL